MPKRSSKPRADVVQNAKRVFDHVITETETVSLTVIQNPAMLSQVMAAMGRKGGKIGGKRRLKTMTPERRTEVAKQAADARWAKARKTKKTA